MDKRTKLTLRREVLAEIETEGLSGLVGGGQSRDTCASCLTYVSCWLTDCIGVSRRICIETG